MRRDRPSQSVSRSSSKQRTLENIATSLVFFVRLYGNISIRRGKKNVSRRRQEKDVFAVVCRDKKIGTPGSWTRERIESHGFDECDVICKGQRCGEYQPWFCSYQ